MYISLLWTRSQSGFVAFWIGLLSLVTLVLVHEIKERPSVSTIWHSSISRVLIVLVVAVGIITIQLGTGAGIVNSVQSHIFDLFTQKPSTSTPSQPSPTQAPTASVPATPPPAGELGGTDSLTIRSFVWEGAIKLFQKHPLFGTGVETFGFAYYSVRPEGHNLTSEWDYLYNKAHNEYLNYAATTGGFGLGTYLAFIGLFLFLAAKVFLTKKSGQVVESMNSQITIHKSSFIIGAGLVWAFISILISNFFGFSVVIGKLISFSKSLYFSWMNSPHYDINISLQKHLTQNKILQHQKNKPRSERLWDQVKIPTNYGFPTSYWELDL